MEKAATEGSEISNNDNNTNHLLSIHGKLHLLVESPVTKSQQKNFNKGCQSSIFCEIYISIVLGTLEVENIFLLNCFTGLVTVLLEIVWRMT